MQAGRVGNWLRTLGGGGHTGPHTHTLTHTLQKIFFFLFFSKVLREKNIPGVK